MEIEYAQQRKSLELIKVHKTDEVHHINDETSYENDDYFDISTDHVNTQSYSYSDTNTITALRA